MRSQFVEVKTRKEAVAACPWAEKIVKVYGGYYCFESVQDWVTWSKQK